MPWPDHETLQEWSDTLFFSFDRDGEEQLLDVDGRQVMMAWEKPWMEQCVDALEIDGGCDVLEVGFGTGYSAERIQRAGPKSHTIIECSETVLERLHLWAAHRPNVIVVEGTWQERLPELGVFDRIFFDDYARCGREEEAMMKCPNPQYIKVYNSMEQHFNGFLKIAFQWHSHEGTRLSGYTMAVGGTEELDADVFDINIKFVQVMPPLHCNYFFSDRAMVPVFTLCPTKTKVDIQTRRKRRCTRRSLKNKKKFALSRMANSLQHERAWANS